MNSVERKKYGIWAVGEDLDLTTFIKKIFFIHSDSELSDVEKEAGINIDDIFNFEDNKDEIFNQYDFTESNSNDNEASIDLIKANTWVKVPRAFIRAVDNILNEKIYPTPPTISYEPALSAYLNEKIEALIKDERYAPSLVLRDRKRLSALEKKNININVFVYSRNLDRLINLSAFVQTCNITVAGGGGNFQIVLPPIPAEYDSEGNLLDIFDSNIRSQVWQFEHKGKTNYYAKNIMTKLGRPEDRPLLNPNRDSTYAPADEYRAEDLDLEDLSFIPRNTFSPQKEQEVENPVLRNIAYFNVALSSNDLVFIKFEELQIEAEDGKRTVDPFEEVFMSDVNNNFFDMIGLIDSVGESYSAASADLSINVSGRDLSKMLLEDGAYFFPATEERGGEKGYQSNYFGNRDVLNDSPSFNRLLGVVQDVKLFTNQPLYYPLTFILDKISTISVFDDGVFDAIDADDDEFLQSWQDNLNALTSKDNIEPEKKDARVGIWKFCNLIIDPAVRDRIMVDSSIATDSGSLMNFISKICDGRFVEFFTDTYNDRFYWIVRRPPYSEQAFLNNFRVVVEEENVISTTLAINDSEAYSWYRLIPQKAYFGDVNLAKYYFPAQFFPEFADVFGSKPMEVTSNYVETASQLTSSYLSMFRSSIEELRFLIESNAHLPFTRKGSITINGDRRIKKGMCIYLASTDELFHVDSVSNSYNVNRGTTERITTVEVSRGIVLRHSEKYFRIINYTQPTEAQVSDRKLNYTVNQTYFDFLLKKKQFRE